MGFENYKPVIILIGCQFMYAGATLFVRAALLEDMSSRVLVVYRQCIAFFFMAPIAFLRRRGGRDASRMEWKSFLWILLLSFVGVTANHNAYYKALTLISSSVASAMNNLAPVMTFIMAYILGLEKINLTSSRSIAKIIGTVVCVSGGATLALVKGPKLLNTEFQTRSQETEHDQTWLIGCFLAFVSAFSWSLSLILQVNVTAGYKDHISLTAWMSLMAAMQSGILTLIIEPNMNAWKLTSPLQLFCCLYVGMTSAVIFYAQAWCIKRRGPLFSAMFQPLCTTIVTVFGCIFMHEELYTGSLIGGLAAIIGMYIVLWGKAKDNEDVKEKTTTFTQVSDKCTIDLEEPLVPQKLST